MQHCLIEKTTKGRPYGVSKFLYLDMLLDPVEFADLLKIMGSIHFFLSGQIIASDEWEEKIERVINSYKQYIEALFTDKKSLFPAICLTKDLSAVYALAVGERGVLIKYNSPIIQIVEHQFIITTDFRLQSMVFGPETIRFGLRFSFPTLFIDPLTQKVVSSLKEESVNAILFKGIQSWMRENTRPTRILMEDKKIVGTFRLGLKARDWINDHVDLKKNGVVIL